MSYGLIYTIPFASFKKESCVVEIEKEGYTGRVLELIGAESPFTVDISDEEFLYTPTRFSTANIRIVGNDYLQSLFSTAYQEYRVTFKRKGIVIWCGFIKPEIYTQDYNSEIFELEIECMSALSTLEYLDYKQAGEESRIFVSLWDLLKKCITSSCGLYDSIYMPHVYASSESDYNSGVNVLQNMKVSEQDFFDEDDKPMKLKEVLEEICKLLNWTVCDWKGSLYFVDIDHIGEYYKYSPDLASKLGGISPNLLNVQKVGFAGSDHALDVLTGRNKVTVKTSNYPVIEMLPSEDGKFKGLTKFGNEYHVELGKKTTLKQFYLPYAFKLHRYIAGSRPIPDSELDKYKDSPNDILGAQLVKRSQYETTGGKNYNWEYLTQVRSRRNAAAGSGALYTTDQVLSLVSPLPAVAYQDGAICISVSVQVTDRDDLTIGYGKKKGKWVIRCTLNIGDMWYRGTTKQWQNTKGTFDLTFQTDNYDGSRFVENNDTKDLNMPYEGITGYIIEVPNNIVLKGPLEFSMSPLSNDLDLDSTAGNGYYMKDLKFTYHRRDGLEDLEDNSDRTYENVVNEKFINELDEIEFKISSYNNDGACYSKVMLGDNYLKDNLYSAIENKLVRPEEHLIRRIIKRYSAPHIKLTQVIREAPDFTPISRLSDSYMVDKRFINIGGSIDYKTDQFECIMIEV